jgi:hypothetical protein
MCLWVYNETGETSRCWELMPMCHILQSGRCKWDLPVRRLDRQEAQLSRWETGMGISASPLATGSGAGSIRLKTDLLLLDGQEVEATIQARPLTHWSPTTRYGSTEPSIQILVSTQILALGWRAKGGKIADSGASTQIRRLPKD